MTTLDEMLAQFQKDMIAAGELEVSLIKQISDGGFEPAVAIIALANAMGVVIGLSASSEVMLKMKLSATSALVEATAGKSFHFKTGSQPAAEPAQQL